MSPQRFVARAVGALGVFAVAVACGGPEADVLRWAVSDAASDDGTASGETSVDASNDAGGDAAPDACAGKDLVTNREHCGACFRSCLGGGCTDGGCSAVLVATVPSPGGLAVDDDRVFYTSVIDDGGVYSSAKDGADKRLLVGGLALPQRTILSGAAVFFNTLGIPGILGRVEKSGATLRTLAKTNGSASQVAIDGATVYFLDGAVIRKMPLDGWPADAGLPPAFATGVSYPWGLAVAGNDIVWSSRGTVVVADGGAGRFTAADGAIFAAPKDGSAGPRVLASGQKAPLEIAADATGIYWVAGEGGEVWRLPAGSSTPMLLASNQLAPYGIALDDRYAYVTCSGAVSGAGFIARLRKDGSGSVDVLATDLAFPSAIALDDRAVYWSNTHGGTVMKIAK